MRRLVVMTEAVLVCGLGFRAADREEKTSVKPDSPSLSKMIKMKTKY